MNEATEFSQLPAETAHRFRPVLEMVRLFLSDFGDKPRLLDVGGYPGTFAGEFKGLFPRWEVKTLDKPHDHIADYVSGNGAALPFDTGSFDVVVTIDTFQHIAAADRVKFVQELCRVSRNVVVLAAPFAHPAVSAVERLLNSAHERFFLKPHPVLADHVAFGLPSLEMTVATWPGSHGVVDVEGSYDLAAWTTWQGMNLMAKLRGEVDNSFAAYDAALASAPTPLVTEVPYRRLISARRGAPTRNFPSGFDPLPSSGTAAIEMARLYCRILELAAGDLEQTADKAGSVLIDQRLKEALRASEQQIGALEARAALLQRSPEPMRPAWKLFRR